MIFPGSESGVRDDSDTEADVSLGWPDGMSFDIIRRAGVEVTLPDVTEAEAKGLEQDATTRPGLQIPLENDRGALDEIATRMREFVGYWETLAGDEKGEAQVFCDRLFQAFGHAGYKEAGATLEHRVRGNGDTQGTGYADLVWKPRVLIEMKKRGERLQLHFRQAFDYWLRLVPNRPRFVILCNFDEFWIYDFDRQIDEPVDRVATTDLPRRYPALNFLFPDRLNPQFGVDREAITREAASQVGELFRRLVGRGEDRARAQRFILQLVVAMFAEDSEMMPRGIVSRMVDDCLGKGESSFDLFGALFRQMDTQQPARVRQEVRLGRGDRGLGA